MFSQNFDKLLNKKFAHSIKKLPKVAQKFARPLINFAKQEKIVHTAKYPTFGHTVVTIVAVVVAAADDVAVVVIIVVQNILNKF